MAAIRQHLRRPTRRGPLRDTRGTAALEFAILAPLIITLLLGIMELGFVAMVDASLEMAIRQAARYGMVTPDADSKPRNDRIREIVESWVGRWLARPDDIDIRILSYPAFDNIGEPEPFQDDNDNGTWDPGEAYKDLNEDGTWNADMGTAGAGGREEIVLYEIAFARPTLTGIPILAGIDQWRFSRRTAVQNE